MSTRRLSYAVLLTTISLVLALAAVLGLARVACVAVPPPLEAPPPILAATPRQADGRSWLHQSWREERHGISVFYLKGSPFAIGYTSARLSADLFSAVEHDLYRTVAEHIPSWPLRWLTGALVLLWNHDLPRYVSLEYQLEILGAAHGLPDHYPAYGPLYHRLLNYHAAHDISHLVADTPLVGCTAFAAWGQHTVDGHLLVGRNFDFEAGRSFDRNKMVVTVDPEQGYGFVSVVWPGMSGAVTAINEQRLYVSINGGHSEHWRRIGVPISLVVRQVAQYAATIAEAVALIQAAPVFVSENFLLADGASGRAVIVEKTPLATAVVTPAPGDTSLVLANHFRSLRLADDPNNLAYLASGTSRIRQLRMEELLVRARGVLDIPAAVGILRDRGGLGDRFIGNGNRSALNALIATHSVVADVSAGVLWVSSGPHQLGRYVPFSIGHDAAKPAPDAVSADPFLLYGEYQRHVAARPFFEHAAALLDQRDAKLASRFIAWGRILAPASQTLPGLEGELALLRGERMRAISALTRALEQQPPFREERQRLQALLQAARAP